MDHPRYRVGPEDCAVLNSFKNIRLTVLVTHSGIDNAKIEPVDSNIAEASLRTLYEHAERHRAVLYWWPIVPGPNDSRAHLERARELSAHAHATVEVTDRAIIVEGLDESPHHSLQQGYGYGYQRHDRAKPHHRQHGRAPIGWKAENGTPVA